MNKLKMSMLATKHELEFNKRWVRKNPQLALNFAQKFHNDYSEKYRIALDEKKYYITLSADLRQRFSNFAGVVIERNFYK